MALKSTIHKAELQIADLDRQHYATHRITVAKHPSETDARMMLRLLAFVLHADERLMFGRGISTDDEPDLWLKNLTDEIDLWIDLGCIDEKRVRQASGRARAVQLYTYNDRSEKVWWPSMQSKCQRCDNVKVAHIDDLALDAMALMASKSMHLQFTMQDGDILVSDGSRSATVALQSRL